jgi:hypothetical protein
MGDLLGWFCSASVALLVFLIAAAIVQDKQHDDLLRVHGCQLLKEAPTGRYRWVGKLREAENVYVYECIDGTKTEVH